MKYEDVKVIEENLMKFKKNYSNLKYINEFVDVLKVKKSLDIYSSGVPFVFYNKYDSFGEEFIELLLIKKKQIEEEMANFTLDNLLPVEKNGLGIKFKTKSLYSRVDDGVYYYKLNEDRKFAIVSWYCKGSLENFTYYNSECEDNFYTGKWIKL